SADRCVGRILRIAIQVPGGVDPTPTDRPVVVGDPIGRLGGSSAADGGAYGPCRNNIPAEAPNDVRAGGVGLQAERPGLVDLELERPFVCGPEEVRARVSPGVSLRLPGQCEELGQRLARELLG